MSHTDAVLCQRIAKLTRRKKLPQGRKARIAFLLKGVSGCSFRFR
jgi:hypothetical protein